MNKTLVKSKIILKQNGKALVIYVWIKTWWFFGYWTPSGSVSCNYKIENEKINLINPKEVGQTLFKKFIHS